MSDFDAYAENLADPVATQHHLSGVVDRRTALRSFAANMGFWLLQGAGWWGVELKERGELVGTVGAFFRETGAVVPDAPPAQLELGWMLYRRFWKQGFASEAAAGALAYGLDAHNAQRAIAYVSPSNAASISVCQRLGMRYENDVELYGHVVGLYAIER